MTLFAVIALAATVAFLILGVGAMVRGGEYDRVYGTRYMALRVAAQGAAVLFLVLAMLATVH
ncbi:MAG: HIG1 domain-containing protein [Betaproteobacteria bacterium]|nr:HIG1 domain-containing protein [Betaproteobacteria bacterium]